MSFHEINYEFHTLDSDSGPLHSKYFVTGPSNCWIKIPVVITNLQNHKKWPARMTVLGSSESFRKLVILSLGAFSKLEPQEEFLEMHFSFLKFICGILNRGMANSFWNHVIQISIRLMYFKDIYSNLWKVKIFRGNIYSIKTNIYFWGTVMYVQDVFLYLVVTRHKLTVHNSSQEVSIWL